MRLPNNVCRPFDFVKDVFTVNHRVRLSSYYESETAQLKIPFEFVSPNRQSERTAPSDCFGTFGVKLHHSNSQNKSLSHTSVTQTHLGQQLAIYRPPRETRESVAQTYSDAFEKLPATRRIRRIVWGVLHTYFRPVDHLLEINCGTGTDAMELASNGMYILATDASSEMVSIVRSKIASTALYSFITPMQLPFHRLNMLNGERFDGAYSNFGGLNCTRNLKQVAFDLANLVKPSKHVVLCLMPDFSIWETLSFLLRGKFKQAFRRRQPDGVLASMNGERVWVHHYSPKKVRAAFAPYFDFVELKGLNVFAPPPSAQRTNKVLGRAVRLFELLDDALPTNLRINGWGDHYVIVFRRKV